MIKHVCPRLYPAHPPLGMGISAYTLIEMLVAVSATAIMGAAIFASMLGLRKSFVATEQFSSAQAAQARLLEYVSRDLRAMSGTSAILSPAISTGSYSPIGHATAWGTAVTAASVATGTLTLVVPGYYASGTGNASNVFIYQSGSMAYGTLVSGNAVAVTGTIQYFKAPQNYGNPLLSYDSYWHYVRVESTGTVSGTSTIVEKADGMLLDLIQSGTGTPAAYTVRVRFTPSFQYNLKGIPAEPSGSESCITTSDYVLLRGTN